MSKPTKKQGVKRRPANEVPKRLPPGVKRLRTLEGHQQQIYSVAFDPQGLTLASGSSDGTVKLWEARSGNLLRTLKGRRQRIYSVAFDPQGLTLASGSNDGMDVYLVIRQTDEASGGQTIRWMNVTRYLKARKDKQSRQIIYNGEKLDMEAVWKVRDEFFPPQRVKK